MNNVNQNIDFLVLLLYIYFYISQGFIVFAHCLRVLKSYRERFMTSCHKFAVLHSDTSQHFAYMVCNVNVGAIYNNMMQEFLFCHRKYSRITVRDGNGCNLLFLRRNLHVNNVRSVCAYAMQPSLRPLHYKCINLLLIEFYSSEIYTEEISVLLFPCS